MSRVKFGDVVKDVKINIDRLNNPYEYYVAGDHMDSEDLTIHRKGCFTTDDVGPAFIRVFKPGQILYGSRRTYLKKIAVADFEGVCANTTFVFETKDPHAFEQRLLPFIMLSKDFTTWSIAKSKGSTNPYVLFSDLADFEFELPPLEEQKVLVDKLWAAYRLKEAYKKLLVATDEMVKSQFIEMFGNQNTNDKGWTESLVKDEFKLSMGKTPARNNPECWDNGTHKWVSISDMSSYTRYTGDTSEYITDYAIADSGIKAVPKGTIIMSFKLSIGRTAITSEDLYTNEAIMAFAGFDEKKFNIDFLHFLIANKNWLLGAKQAVKGQTLNKESIGNAKIIIPPIEAQEEFASIYNQADKSKSVIQKALVYLNDIQSDELGKIA